MPKLPQFSGREAVKIFQHFGWVIARQRGSHIILVKDSHNATLSVLDHKEVAQGTLPGLIRVAGLSDEEFIDVSRQV
jgi:predicted RNA binding protein YcfA (HicA-like mRNA interferase family)